jgi:hypothetical protein
MKQFKPFVNKLYPVHHASHLKNLHVTTKLPEPKLLTNVRILSTRYTASAFGSDTAASKLAKFCSTYNDPDQ